jgi:hypothetical protein
LNKRPYEGRKANTGRKFAELDSAEKPSHLFFGFRGGVGRKPWLLMFEGAPPFTRSPILRKS